MTYIVTCTLCEFQHEIDELEDVFEFEDTHEADCGDHHTIEWERLEHPEQSTD